jgi:hypothetical protein
MNIFTNFSGARSALLYITGGSLLTVWSALALVYMKNHAVESRTDAPFYVGVGFLLSGVTLFVIGVAVGSIGRSAREADQLHAVVATQDSHGNAAQELVPVSENLPPATSGVVRGQPAIVSQASPAPVIRNGTVPMHSQ